MRTWVDASTLIALDAAGEIEILRVLLGRTSITEEVEAEVFGGRESRSLRDARGEWIEVVEMKGDRRRWTALGLGRGEASLFLTPRQNRLVLDEIPARTVAEAEGREYVGLVGLLLAGVRRRILSAAKARDVLRKLMALGFHLTSALYDEALREVGG